MKLLVCLECGALFEEPAEWEEKHGLDCGPYERWSGCPSCYGGYTDAHRCNECEEWIVDDYIKIGDKRYCSECYLPMELGEE